MKTQYVIILVMAKGKKEATKIAQGLLEAKLIACANIIDGVESKFWWQGKINSSKETLIVLKTKRVLFKKVAAKVKTLHSYQVPEIIALPIMDGVQNYLNWIDSNLDCC